MLVDLTNMQDELAQRARKHRDKYTGENKPNWHRETGNTGINTLGKTSDTWRGWRQSQGQVKLIRV